MADIMQRILAPDGCLLALEGLRKPITRLNFNLQVELDRDGPPQAMLVHPGRTLDVFKEMVLPPTYKVVRSEELSLGGSRLGVAQLRIETTLGVPRELVWLGLQTKTSFLRTSFRGSDQKAAIERFLEIRFEEHETGVVISNPIVQDERPLEAIHADGNGVLVTASRLGTLAVKKMTPTNGGLAVQGGQLYANDGRRRTLTLVSPTALVKLQSSTATSDRGSDVLTSLGRRLVATWN
jgi:hypothetical protein